MSDGATTLHAQPVGIAAPVAVALAVAAVAGVIVVVLAPLLVYSMTLAAFGAAHVLSELRYVDRRFGAGLGARLAASMGLLIAGAAAARASGVFGLLAPATALTLELSFVVALALLAARGGMWRKALAIGVAVALGMATAMAPFDTAISLSILHNLTPLAFLWEIAPSQSRWRTMLPASLAFVGLPLLVATGLPRLGLATLGFAVPFIDPLGVGALADHLYIYVPAPLQATGSAIDLFSASVVAQCAHYAAVILVLPALLSARQPGAAGLIKWPAGAAFAAILVAVSLMVFFRFESGFVSARALYGIAASVHAWIEIPLIVIALTQGVRRTV